MLFTLALIEQETSREIESYLLRRLMVPEGRTADSKAHLLGRIIEQQCVADCVGRKASHIGIILKQSADIIDPDNDQASLHVSILAGPAHAITLIDTEFITLSLTNQSKVRTIPLRKGCGMEGMSGVTDQCRILGNGMFHTSALGGLCTTPRTRGVLGVWVGLGTRHGRGVETGFVEFALIACHVLYIS